jgi:UDP-N-acetylmuramoyl-tripeptide--D-alanyl-D-alanine ligase
MENIFLHEVIAATKGEFILGDPHSPVKSISIDTRTLKSGEFYIAIVGKNFDGHDFLRQAVDRRAAGLIVSRIEGDWGNPFPAMPAVIKVADTQQALGDIASCYRKKWNIPLIGITGSNGKTTTKEMIAGIF